MVQSIGVIVSSPFVNSENEQSQHRFSLWRTGNACSFVRTRFVGSDSSLLGPGTRAYELRGLLLATEWDRVDTTGTWKRHEMRHVIRT
jgi:hypothetical protein